ncbi:MAG TPA: CehA/McbA family metallohydrolase [Herpetosiphonaceae bacterium]
MSTIVLNLTGYVTPEDKQNNDYRYVPFDLPAPAARLHVSYHYAPAQPADAADTVIDIGLFDPRGAAFPGGSGFRGWSGGARSEFTITPADATPGYLPGPLPAGRYQVILGLYRIPACGVDYALTIEATLADGAQQQPTIEQDRLPSAPHGAGGANAERFWLRGDLQSHTEHSDARGTLAQLTAKARALGLDFLAITDHNTISHHVHLDALADDDLLLIPGQEVTTYYGHMNVWGARRWCDFRCRSAAEMTEVIALAHAHGGVCSINHPKRDGPAWEYDPGLPVDAIEVWQGPWPWRNTESLAFWERLLQSGRQIPAVGGSDYHCPAGEEIGFLRLGQPTTWVKVGERSIPAILDAIRSGRTSISAMPDGPRLDLRATAGGSSAEMGGVLQGTAGAPVEVEVQVERGAGWTLRLVADGVIAHETPITDATTTVRHTLAAERYIRAELVGDAPPEILPPNAPPGIDLREWRWALSNPIYVAP